MDRSNASELEFDKVLELVAAHARTGVGRAVVRALVEPLGGAGDRLRAANLSLAVEEIIEDSEPFGLSGVDDAIPWLEPDSPLPAYSTLLAPSARWPLRILTVPQYGICFRKILTAIFIPP